MVIALASMHPVLGELRTLFLDGVTRSSKMTWSSLKINRGTDNFAWDIESCSSITLHFCAKLDKNKSSVRKKKRLMGICAVDGVAVFMK